jgi:outer membrane protein assembly factor BamB
MAGRDTRLRRLPALRNASLVAAIVALLLGGCDGLELGGTGIGCEPPPEELVSDLPEVADVVDATNNAEWCTRELIVRPRGVEIDQAETALVDHFRALGWELAEDDLGWGGTLGDGARRYALRLLTEFRAAGGVVEAERRSSAARIIRIELHVTDGLSWVPPLSEGITGPLLGSPRFVAGNVVVPTGQELTGYSAATGAELWRSEVCPRAAWSGAFEAGPTDVAVVWCDGYQYGIDGASGETLWRDDPPDGYVDRTRIGHGVVVTMSVDRGGVWVADAASGETRWLRPSSDASIATNATAVFLASDGEVRAFDAVTGSRLWSAPYPSSGLFADDRGVYARGNDHQMRRLDPSTGALVWEAPWIAGRLEWSEVIGTTDRTVVVQRTRGVREVTVFDVETGAVLWTADGQVEDNAGGRSPDGAADFWVSARDGWIVIADIDRGTLRVHDDETGAVAADLGRPGAQFATIQGDRVAYVRVVDGERRLETERLG